MSKQTEKAEAEVKRLTDKLAEITKQHEAAQVEAATEADALASAIAHGQVTDRTYEKAARLELKVRGHAGAIEILQHELEEAKTALVVALQDDAMAQVTGLSQESRDRMAAAVRSLGIAWTACQAANEAIIKANALRSYYRLDRPALVGLDPIRTHLHHSADYLWDLLHDPEEWTRAGLPDPTLMVWNFKNPVPPTAKD